MIGAHHSPQVSRRWLPMVLRWIAGVAILAVMLHFLPLATVRSAIAQIPAWFFVTVLLGYLLAHALGIAFGHGLRLTRRFVHLNGAINLLLEHAKIIRVNLLCHLLNRVQSHECTLLQREFWNFFAVYSTFLWRNHSIARCNRGNRAPRDWL